jgi:hypothetical protein
LNLREKHRHRVLGLTSLGLRKLNENLGAINVQLTPADLREIDTAVSKIQVHGGRMNEEQMNVVDQTA